MIALLLLFIQQPTPTEPSSGNNKTKSSQTERLGLVGHVKSSQKLLAGFELTVRAENYSSRYSHLNKSYQLTLNRSQFDSRQLLITAAKSGYISVTKPIIIPRNSRTVQVNFTLLKGKEMVFKGYNSQKEPIGYKKLVGNDFDRYQNTFYLTNRNWQPIPSSISTQGPWLQSEVPIRRNVTLNLLWPVKEFGKILLRAHVDHEKVDSLYLNRLIAETEFEFLERDIDSFRERGYVNSSLLRHQILPLFDKARRLLTKAKEVKKPESAVYYQKSLNYTLWAGEKLYLARADSWIDNKQKQVSLRVADAVFDNNGQPLQLNIEQQSRQFRFGWFLLHPNHGKILERLRRLPTNYANIFAFWWQTEPEPGQFNLTPVHKRLKDLKGKDVAVSGLIGDSPKYTSKLSDTQLKRNVTSHVKHLVKKLPALGPWECYGLGMNWGADQSLQMTKGRPQQINQETTETCIKAVNRYSGTKPIVTGWNIDGRNINYPFFDQTPYDYFKELNGSYQIGFDFVYFGSAHEMYPGLIEDGVYTVDEASEKVSKIPARDLATIGRLLDHYSRLNKSMHLQYFQAPSNYNNYTLGYWHHPWNESVQAEWISKIYKLAYGHPQVKSINYLEVHDEDWRQVKNGLLSSSGEPKRSYFTLKNLLKGWRSPKVNLNLTKKKREITIELWPGVYRLKLIKDDKVIARDKLVIGSSKKPNSIQREVF